MVNEEQQRYLLGEYTTDEVRNAMFGIPGNKAPGPDGFSAQFFHDCWSIIGDSISAAVIDGLNKGSLLKVLNTTSITLIPKMLCPNGIGDYRPIPCCNV